jgi:hypothetical protein
MGCIKLKILIILLFSSAICFAQNDKVLQKIKDTVRQVSATNLSNKNDSVSFYTVGGLCRNKQYLVVEATDKNKPKIITNNSKSDHDNPPFLAIHGNVLYNFNYRSYIDTPFAQTGMMQHTVQTFVDGDVAGKYPFRSVFTYRASNSPYFSNNSDFSLQYRQSDMLEKVKDELRKDADNTLNKDLLINPSSKYQLGELYNDSLEALNKYKVPGSQGLYEKFDSLYDIYETKRRRLEELEDAGGNTSDPLQAIIEAREAKLLQSARSTISDSLANVSNLKNAWNATKYTEYLHKNSGTDTSTTASSNIDSTEIKIKKAQDSIAILQKEVIVAEQKILLFQKKLTDSVLLVKKKINQLKDPASVSDYISTQDTAEQNRLTKAQKFLLSVNQIGIGRSWISYSELTVKDVSLNGFNIEMNPGKLYMATAVGNVNSQFQDFILNNNTSPKQSVKLIRLGAGRKNKSNVIFTLYGGKKALLNTTNTEEQYSTQSIIGASLSSTIKLTKNISVTGEYARSSYSDIYNPGHNTGLFNRVSNFSMRANEAYDITFQSVFPRTNTKIDGDYKKMGAAFQSFTIYSSNVKQDAFSLHVNQLLWKKKLIVDASIKKNDFNSPLTAPGYTSSAVFKSIQLSLAIPKYPFVSVGYYPSSQLFVGPENTVYQSWYNTLNAITSYSYIVAKLNMTTNAVYTKFYNNETDTSFAYFNATTFTLNHSVYLNPFILEGILTVTDQKDIHLLTVEPKITYKYKNILTLTGSVKWSKLNGTQTLWGGSGGAGIILNHIGTIQCSYDKTYLPSYAGVLMPIGIGRITFNKTF